MIEQWMHRFISRMLLWMIGAAIAGVVGMMAGLVVGDKGAVYLSMMLMAVAEIIFGGAIILVVWIDWRRTLRGRRGPVSGEQR